jgi:hypothetical protein
MKLLLLHLPLLLLRELLPLLLTLPGSLGPNVV